MQEASEAWKRAHEQTLLPETFVDITLTLSDNANLNVWTIDGERRVEYAPGIKTILERNGYIPEPQYHATLDENLWLLDGTRQLFSDDHKTASPGYIHEYTDGTMEINVRFRNIIETATPGMSIVWSSEYGEYPTEFEMIAYRGDTDEIAQTIHVTGNKSNVSYIDAEFTGYNRITLRVLEWNFPNHRVRLDRWFWGTIVEIGKNDILSFTGEQSGDLLSASLPKNNISFSVDNSDGRWNLTNPSGVGKYLMEQQKLTVRYGMTVNGATEWIPGGTFYLTEWNAPSNGVEARFVACDALEFAKNNYFESSFHSGSLDQVIMSAYKHKIGISEIQAISDLDEPVDNWSYDIKLTIAENIQLVANEYSHLIWFDRENTLHVMPLNKTLTDYIIPLERAYHYPEITLSKPLKDVAVKGYSSTGDENDSVTDHIAISVNLKGEIQTIDNPRLYNWLLDSEKNQRAIACAEWARDVLVSRKKVSGEFRADPRLDLYDIVEVESKYGTLTPVAITNIKYTYNGSFRGYYEGQVIVM